jgi:hypothetical protein
LKQVPARPVAKIHFEVWLKPNYYSGMAEKEITEQVISSVNEGVEQALMESVAGILSLEGSHERWDNPHHRNAALSMEALTTTVMQRYWMVSYINQNLKEKISASLQG